MTVPPAAAAETELPTMINDDEFIENGTVTHENSSDNMNHNDGTTKSDLLLHTINGSGLKLLFIVR